MDQNSQVHRDGLKTQIKEAYGRVVYTYTTHWKMVDALVAKSRYIKYAQIALSAISTGGFIGSIITNETALTCIGGIFSTALLALNLYFKDFNLNADITRHSTAANALWSIRESYVSLLTDFPNMSIAEICARRDELQAMTAEVYKSAPKTDSKSYAAAQNALNNEEKLNIFRNCTSLRSAVLPNHPNLVGEGMFQDCKNLSSAELPDGITSGLSATQFGPNTICNRAQIVTFLYRAIG